MRINAVITNFSVEESSDKRLLKSATNPVIVDVTPKILVNETSTDDINGKSQEYTGHEKTKDAIVNPDTLPNELPTNDFQATVLTVTSLEVEKKKTESKVVSVPKPVNTPDEDSNAAFRDKLKEKEPFEKTIVMEECRGPKSKKTKTVNPILHGGGTKCPLLFK